MSDMSAMKTGEQKWWISKVILLGRLWIHLLTYVSRIFQWDTYLYSSFSEKLI